MTRLGQYTDDELAAELTKRQFCAQCGHCEDLLAERALADDLADEVKHLRRVIDADHGHLKPIDEPADDVLARWQKAREQMMTGVWPAKAGESTVALDDDQEARGHADT